LSLGIALVLPLVLQPLFVFAADMPMTPPTLPTPSPGSTPSTAAQTSPKVITCPESSPGCSIDKSITMIVTDKGIMFSSKPTEHGDPYEEDPRVHITSLVQKSLEKKLQQHQEGVYAGYIRGFLDGKAGKDKEDGKGEIIRPRDFADDAPLRSYSYGLSSGYDDGYAAGVFERSLGLTK
jgi:hypothetical protein